MNSDGLHSLLYCEKEGQKHTTADKAKNGTEGESKIIQAHAKVSVQNGNCGYFFALNISVKSSDQE